MNKLIIIHTVWTFLVLSMELFGSTPIPIRPPLQGKNQFEVSGAKWTNTFKLDG